MIRAFATALALSALCCHQAVMSTAPEFGGFASREARESACLDLRDHTVAIYSDAYLSEHGDVLGAQQLEAFRAGWSEELAKRGTFDRFEAACMTSLTPSGFTCAASATTPETVVSCMRFANHETENP